MVDVGPVTVGSLVRRAIADPAKLAADLGGWVLVGPKPQSEDQEWSRRMLLAGYSIAYEPAGSGRSLAVPLSGTLDDLHATYERFSKRAAARAGVDAHTRPSLLRMQIWDFLPPRSIAQCSTAGSFRVRLERGNA